MRYYLFFVGVMMVSVNSYADSLDKIVTRYTTKDCPLVEVMTLDVRFNRIENTPMAAIDFVQSKMDEVKKATSGYSLETLEFKNVNYTVDSITSSKQVETAQGMLQENVIQWKISGSMSIVIEPSVAAKKAFIALAESGVHPRLSVQATQQTPCKRQPLTKE